MSTPKAMSLRDSSKYVEVAGNEYNEVTPGMTVAKDPFVQINEGC